MKAWLRGARFTAFVLILASVSPVHAQTDLEYKVKAAFLFNFLKFVTWPPERAPGEGKPYVLCVMGDTRFRQTLDAAIHGKTVSGHPMEVRDRAVGTALGECHLAYLAPGLSPPVTESALAGADGESVLTVHEAEAPLPSGVVRFFLEQQRVRFEINTVAAERRNLHLSSRLLGVAARVQVASP